MKPKKKSKKSLFRRINDWLHLWLGLFSGIIVFIVSITGCFYAFQQEIKDAMEPWRFVEARDAAFVPPSVLLNTAKAHMPEKEPTGLTYSNKEGAAAVGYHTFENGKEGFSVVFMNPYSGEFLKKMQTEGTDEFDFFHFIIDGHRALWLPYEIGRPIVGIATLIFLVMLISGLIMWWPKKWNKSGYKKSFSIKWNGKFKRVNYDLHNVLGFYTLIFAFIIAVTGLVWSFKWFEDSLYYVTSAGETKAAHEHPHSDLSQAGLVDNETIPVLDRAFYKVIAQEPNAQGFYMTPVLKDPDDAIEVIAYQDFGSWYNRNEYFFDQYNLKRYRTDDDVYVDASFADQLSLLNYDIHVGAVWGLPGKILAFLVSLVSASLPITGFLVWWNKKKKKNGGDKKQLQRKKESRASLT
ncbi:PepSY-associated TM helix domain-containing protein [Salinimicrobium sp. TH3]|uniref:PepSY-associated TM helix domain-containing protein n=1 Tax=Salinimicrobium sp. TH3 TaxID=2997342 RepID=UPI002273763B|nr:PepSY-associated TM helix domain-containing protein [Salinimicrobium sp. TH3]MCY2687524.1 PepSY-associated TM helix domain-containing protein [Salinimicrobium sp. TH3]